MGIAIVLVAFFVLFGLGGMIVWRATALARRPSRHLYNHNWLTYVLGEPKTPDQDMHRRSD